MDYTIVGKHIANLLKRQGADLSEEQYLLMQGWLAGFLMQVELVGLEKALAQLDKGV